MAYVFDPEVLHGIAKGVVGQPTEEMLVSITTELEQRYPKYILTEREWVFSNAGSAMGQIMLLHASLSEYVLLFATATGTEGCSGRLSADDYFMMLEGEHWCYGEGDLDREVTLPGEVAVLPRGEMKAFRIPDRAFALEYARGAIPLMLPFGLADTFTSTLDFSTLWRTLKMYGGATTRNLLRGKV